MPAAPATPPTAPPAASPGSAAPAAPAAPPAIGSTPGVATAPPRPGSAKARMHAELEKSARDPITNAPVTPPVAAPKPADATPPAKPPEAADDPTKAPDPAKPGDKPATPPAAEGGKDKKVSPWRLVDEWKARASQAEARVAELSKAITPEAQEQQKAATERLQRTETRLKELEDEMRFIDYSKSAEFRDKYQAPYEAAWNRAMNDLGEVTVEHPQTGEIRQFTPDDLLALVNLKLPEAKALAKQLAPDFVDDLMQHRNKCRELFDAQSAALNDAKTKGGEREQQRAATIKQLREQLGTGIRQTFQAAKAEITTDATMGKYFQPTEGDEEGNSRLEKGFKLAEAAFAQSPLDPSITPEERAARVKRHAAVIHRAAAFGRLTYQLENVTAERDALKKELDQFKGSTPPDGGGRGGQPAGNGAARGTARDRLHAELEKYAKPA